MVPPSPPGASTSAVGNRGGDEQSAGPQRVWYLSACLSTARPTRASRVVDHCDVGDLLELTRPVPSGAGDSDATLTTSLSRAAARRPHQGGDRGRVRAAGARARV